MALLSFIAVYVALTGWFVWSACRLAVGAFSDGGQESATFLLALPLAFLALFMLKALFFRARSSTASSVEIDAVAEPRLFAFLHRIADEAGAPGPTGCSSPAA